MIGYKLVASREDGSLHSWNMPNSAPNGFKFDRDYVPHVPTVPADDALPLFIFDTLENLIRYLDYPFEYDQIWECEYKPTACKDTPFLTDIYGDFVDFAPQGTVWADSVTLTKCLCVCKGMSGADVREACGLHN